jgi:hypothetical protein
MVTAMPRRSYPWKEIEDKYVTSPDGKDEITLQDLANEYGCSMSRLKHRCADDNWTSKRALYRHNISTGVRQQLGAEEISVRARHIQAGRALQTVGAKKLRTLNPDDISPYEARRYIKDGAEIERQAYGLPERIDVTSAGEQIRDPEPISRGRLRDFIAVCIECGIIPPDSGQEDDREPSEDSEPEAQ